MTAGDYLVPVPAAGLRFTRQFAVVTADRVDLHPSAGPLAEFLTVRAPVASPTDA